MVKKEKYKGDYVYTTEMAEHFECTVQNIIYLAKEGRFPIPHFRKGRLYVWLRSDVDLFLKRKTSIVSRLAENEALLEIY